MRQTGNVVRIEEVNMHTTFLVGKRGGRPPGRPRRRWEGNYKVRPNEIGCEVDWSDLIQNRDQWRAVALTVMNFWLP